MRKILFILLACIYFSGYSQPKMVLKNDKLVIEFSKTPNGWQVSRFEAVDAGGNFIPFGKPNGEYALLFSESKPSGDEVTLVNNGDTLNYLEDLYKKTVMPHYKKSMAAVPLNIAGEASYFYPENVRKDDQSLVFEKTTPYGKYTAIWELDNSFLNDLHVSIQFTASRNGYYSLATPTLATIQDDNILWGAVPGVFWGDGIQNDFKLAYNYAQGLPTYPVQCNENTITTMASILSTKKGVTLAAIPSPGQDRNPYFKDAITHGRIWKVSLSHKNRKSELSPTAYHPVLGEEGSEMKAGESITFDFRYSLQCADWYSVYKHVIYDIYDLKKSLNYKKTEQSLTERVLSMYDYVLDDQNSMWHVEDYNGLKIGAQSYLGMVVGADNDAMKNADYGAVWMLAKATGDKRLMTDRLPYLRNFKIAQQETKPGFAQGATKGQYYLAKKKDFVEEFGDHVEPVALTYYTLMDMGNILLFEPQDVELKNALRLGADRLLAWQHADGGFDVGYQRSTGKPIHTDLKDLRPTFYGFVIAYRLLGDKKYLEAAQKGADWLVENAVKKGHFLGVCGDARFVNDFATGQCVQALLDMYDITKNKKYLDAAVTTARIYTMSIYTHPIPTDEEKTVKGKVWKDWQLSQVGLNFEHGGTMGSAVGGGPILLVSHTGMFVRLYALTKDPLFLDMARAGALGRDAHVNPQNHVASYYWASMNQGPGPWPHHAWWQIGWIMDYLVAEAELRTGGKVKFDRGFMTPKVGPNEPMGFKPGIINGEKVNLVIRKELVKFNDPNVDYIAAQSLDNKKLFVIVLNSQDKECKVNATVNLSHLDNMNKKVETKSIQLSRFGAKILEISVTP